MISDMKTRYIQQMMTACMVVTAGFILGGCQKDEVEAFAGEHSLFFERWQRVSEVERIRIDTAAYTFADYFGQDEIVHPFTVKLIGDLLPEDLEYTLTVIDSLTTATSDQYTLPEHPLFRKDRATDTLEVTMHRVPSLEGKEVYVTLRLTANANFKVGYVGYTDVKLRFNNVEGKPTWWTQEVEDVFLGVYSARKLETVFAANPSFTTFVGLSVTEKRKVALNTRKYIKDNNITEVGGGDMIIPMD